MTIYKIMTNACFILLISMCLADMKQRNKANESRVLFIAILVALLILINNFIGG